MVSKKVALPHGNVLGGVSKQRVNYDRLSLTQVIQGFTNNIFDESDNTVRGYILWYLSDLMEDPQIFRGQVLRLPVLCSSAKWRGAQYVDQIQAALIASEGLMPKNTIILAGKIGLEKIRTQTKHGFVNCIK